MPYNTTTATSSAVALLVINWNEREGEKKIETILPFVEIATLSIRSKYLMQCVTFSVKHDNSLIPEIFGTYANVTMSHRAIDPLI